MGKRKGGSFERDICRLISNFWSDSVFHDLCWRASASGAKGTVTRTKNRSHIGDICATSPSIEPLFSLFSIECKHYADIDVTEILRGLKNNKLLTFWYQTMRSALASKRMPVLIARRNNFPTMLIMRLKDAFLFLDTMKKPIKYMTLGNKIIILTLDDFLTNVHRIKFITKVEELSIDNNTTTK